MSVEEYLSYESGERDFPLVFFIRLRISAAWISQIFLQGGRQTFHVYLCAQEKGLEMKRRTEI